MNREYQYTIVAYDSVGTLTIEYTKEGKPTILRRVPVSPSIKPEELQTWIVSAIQASAPYDIWDIEDQESQDRQAVFQSLVGVPIVAELPPITEKAPLEPVVIPQQTRSITEEDYKLLYDDGLVEIPPEIFFGREAGLP